MVDENFKWIREKKLILYYLIKALSLEIDTEGAISKESMDLLGSLVSLLLGRPFLSSWDSEQIKKKKVKIMNILSFITDAVHPNLKIKQVTLLP